MKLIDSKGRLFGKISVIDLGAALVILMVVIGIFIVPGTSGSVAQVGGKQAVKMDMLVEGLRVSNPQTLKQNMKKNSTTKLLIRNQPHGEVEIDSVELMPKSIYVPQPDGSVKVEKDPRQVEQYKTNWLITLAGKARETDDGFVLGGNNLKIGTTLELEGVSYNFRGSLIGIRNE